MSISIARKLDNIFSQIAENSKLSGIEYRQLTQEPILCALKILDKYNLENISINRKKNKYSCCCFTSVCIIFFRRRIF